MDTNKPMRLKGGQTTLDVRLDRVVEFDEKSRNFPIRTVLPSQTPRSRTWTLGVWNDQGQEGACVGFAWSHELSCTPVPVRTNAQQAFAIYKRAQQIDEWAGENYSGTSVLAGAKAVAELGRLDEYRWAFGVDDLILSVGHHGPGVAGLTWHQGQFRPDAKGFIRPTGPVMGGHAILIKGIVLYKKNTRLAHSLENIDRDRSYFILHNSWGRSWGKVGSCYMTVTDMNTLLEEQGEVCIPVRRK